jgi:hypothetical protein
MPLTTKQLVSTWNARRSDIEAKIAALQEELALLKGTTTGLRRGAKRKAVVRELRAKVSKRKGPSAAALKKMSAERKRVWAEVKRLGLKNLAELKKYKAKKSKPRARNARPQAVAA